MRHIEADSVERNHPAEADGDTAHTEQCVISHLSVSPGPFKKALSLVVCANTQAREFSSYTDVSRIVQANSGEPISNPCKPMSAETRTSQS